MNLRKKLRHERAAQRKRKLLDENETPPSEAIPEFTPENTATATIFARTFLKFEAKPYQKELLEDTSKRIAVIWPRQSGKSTTLAARMIWYACTHERTLSLIVAPGLRQSMILMDRIQAFLMVMPKPVKRELISKMQRTVIWFKKGSQIVALPNSPNLLRGYTAHQVLTDESAFFRDDELVFYNVLFPMLQTTDGTLIASSTPWGKNSVFYRFVQSPDFTKHKITYEKVIEAGLATRAFIDEMRRNLPAERFRREFEAEFVEDELAYLSQDLITRCIDPDSQFLSDEAFGF
jgi:phage terminase large subunit-like protein